MFATFKVVINHPADEILQRIQDNPTFMQKTTVQGVINAKYTWENIDDPNRLQIKGRGMLLTSFWEMKARLFDMENGQSTLFCRLVLGPVHKILFAILFGSLFYFMIKNGIKLAGTDKLIPFMLGTFTAVAIFFLLPMGILYLWTIKIKKELRNSLS